MHQRATGLILRTRPLTETSLIVHWLTSDLGRLSTVAKGARRPKSPFHGKLDLFYLADFSFIRSRRSELHILREATLRETHPALRRDVVRLQQAAYAAALIEQTSETESPLPNEFELLQGFLAALCTTAPSPSGVLAFELKLLKALGQSPILPEASLSEGSRRVGERLALDPWTKLTQLKPGPDQIRELRQFLHEFINYHLGKLPKGRNAALDGWQGNLRGEHSI